MPEEMFIAVPSWKPRWYGDVFLRDACKNAVNTTGLEVLDFGAEDFAEQQVGEA